MSRGFQLSIVWLATATLACLLALGQLSGTFVDSAYLPATYDSFYHARRILDTVADPGAFYEFDPRIHAPEGSWLTWPWGYDYGMALLVRAVMGAQLWWTGVPGEPSAILAHIPPLAVFLTAALALAVTGALGLTLAMRVVVMAAFAVSSVTVGVHGLGAVDHHFMEYAAFLAVLASALAWLREPARRRYAVLLGAVLGIAPMFQSGLFILQVPVLASLVLLWLRGMPVPAPALCAFAAALSVGTGLILTPSEPFREGFFAYYYLSWFHLHVAAISVLTCVVLAAGRPGRSGCLALLTVLVLGLAPLLDNLASGADYLGHAREKTTQLLENRSVFGHSSAPRLPWRESWVLYSGLVFAVPALIVGGLVCAVSTRRPDWLALSVFTVLLGALTVHAYRFSAFGAPLVYLAPAVLADRWLAPLSGWRRAVAWTCVLGVWLAAFAPGIQNLQATLKTPAGNVASVALAAYRVLAPVCEAAPGVVLADADLGHPLTYFTRCSVIANNFIITPQHAAKLVQLRALLASTPAQVRTHAPWVDYVIAVRHRARHPDGGTQGDPALIFELLSGPPPPGYTLLHQLSVAEGGVVRPALRVFRIER